MEYEGSLIKWILYCKGITFTLEVSPNKSETSEERKKAKMYGISVHYIWGVGRDVGGDISDEYWEEIFNNSLAERFLPQSDFDEIIKKANKPDKDITNLYSLLLENYIEENFFLAYYGKILMEKFLVLNMDWLVEKLCKSCIKKCSYDNKGAYDFQSNIQSLSIIALFYSELIQKNPAIIYKFLSEMAFVVPSVKNDDIYYNTLSPSPHLHHYVHVHKLRDLIRDIQNGKWATLEKPYTSPLLLEIIHIEAESEISQIKKSLEDLTSSFDEFKKEAITKLDGYKE
ncbi:25979_t:CDS:2, partial [Gigaspora rosea]